MFVVVKPLLSILNEDFPLDHRHKNKIKLFEVTDDCSNECFSLCKLADGYLTCISHIHAFRTFVRGFLFMEIT